MGWYIEGAQVICCSRELIAVADMELIDIYSEDACHVVNIVQTSKGIFSGFKLAGLGIAAGERLESAPGPVSHYGFLMVFIDVGAKDKP